MATWLAHARGLGCYADLDYLGFELIESRHEMVLTRALRNEDARCPGKGCWLNDIPDPQHELVVPAVGACADGHFVQLYRGCGKLGLRARLLRRQNRRNSRLRRLLGSRRGVNLPLSCRHKRLKLFDFTCGNNVSVALLQLRLGPQFILRLL